MLTDELYLLWSSIDKQPVPSVQRATDALFGCLAKRLPSDLYNQAESLIGDYAGALERHAFISGLGFCAVIEQEASHAAKAGLLCRS